MKVFLCEPIHRSAYELLQQNTEIINDMKHIDQCDIIITRNIQIDQELMDKCHHLKLIAIHGTGCDDVDMSYAKEKGIDVVNTPGENALSVSELIITMMLELSRRTRLLHNDYIEGKIKSVAPKEYIGNEISYKTFGMIGVGDIAKKTACILRDGFHMNIIGYSRSLTKEKANQLGIGYCETIKEVMELSDFVSIGTSLNEQTYHMISEKELSYMKPTAFLINTARGAIVDEEALYHALCHHYIAGAGIDVLENEPVSPTHRLLLLDNVVYTPHMGATTDEALYRVGMCVVHSILEYIEKLGN